MLYKVFIFICLFLGISSAANQIYFSSGFEAGKTLLAEPADIGASRLELIGTAKIDEWPTGGGNGFLNGPSCKDALPFTYTRRSGTTLSGVQGIDREFFRYAEIRVVSTAHWTGLNPQYAGPVSPGLHGNAALRIRFPDKGHTWALAPFPPVTAFYGRFNIRFSAEAFAGPQPDLVFFMEPETGGFFRIGLKKEKDGYHFLLRFHTKDDDGKKKDIYLVSVARCLPDGVNCVEFFYRADQKNTGASLWINGGEPVESFGHKQMVKPGETIRSLQFGVFSAYCFTRGFMIIDDVVAAHDRIGPVPPAPVLSRIHAADGTVRFSVQPGPERIQYQVGSVHGSWLVSRYTSPLRRADMPVIPDPRLLYPDSVFAVRARSVSRFGTFSEWSRPVGFTYVSAMDQSTERDTFSAILLSVPERETVPHIIPGTWYDLHITMDSARYASLNKVRVVFKNGADPASSHHPGNHFDETAFYNMSFNVPGRACRFWYKYQKELDVTTQSCEFVQGGKETIRFDPAHGQLTARIRFSEKAESGPWIMTVEGIGPDHMLRFSEKSALVFSGRPYQSSRSLTGIFTVTGIVLILLAVILTLWARKIVPPGGDTRSALARQCHHIMDRSLGDTGFSMERLAEELNLNRNYLSQQFKKELGSSFPEYLNRLRLEKAVELLVSTRLQISEVAFQTGYSSPEYFGKVFKSVYGCTPRAYRSRHTVPDQENPTK